MTDARTDEDRSTKKPPEPELKPLNEAERDLNDLKERAAQEQAPRNGK